MTPPVAGSAFDAIRKGVIKRIEERKLDPESDRDGVAKAIDEAIRAFQQEAFTGKGRSLSDPKETAKRLLRSIVEFGPLTELFNRHDIEEVYLEGDRVRYLDSSGRLQALEEPTTEEENRQVIEKLLAGTQRRLDVRSPYVQARVLNQSARLTACIPPVADRLSATIRRRTLKRQTLASLVDSGTLSPEAGSFLWGVMQGRASVLISGAPGMGKTTLLSALLAAIPSERWIRCCEEIRELAVPIVHGSFYEARPAGLDGQGEITLRELVKLVLAMRPDTIVVGEVRGSEAFELTRAVNAGCGFVCTVHANSARDGLNAIVNAAIMAGENVTEPIVRKVFASSLDYSVHLDGATDIGEISLDKDVPPWGITRQVLEIIALVPSLHDDFSTEPIFKRETLGKPLEWTGAFPADADLIERALPREVGLKDVLEGRVNLL